jgi:hypothetical protein
LKYARVVSGQGDRSPGASWSPAPIESVDRWPLVIKSQDSGGEPLRGSRRSPACPWSPDPPPENQMLQPASALTGDLPGFPACGPVLKGSVGAIGWLQCPSGAPGASLEPGGFVRPFRITCYFLTSSEGIYPDDRPKPPVVRGEFSYLVDSASSHMLVSKIKPCMSKYKQNIR